MLSYPPVMIWGKVGSETVLNGPIFVQERLDGSQFRASWTNGEVEFASTRAKIDPLMPPKMFREAVEHFSPFPMPDITIFGVVMNGPKHNVLTYGRKPTNGFILCDAFTDHWFDYEELTELAAQLRVDIVPVLALLDAPTVEEVESDWFSTESYLGGQIGGVVFKNYETRYVHYGALVPTFVKRVRPGFQEKNSRANPSKRNSVDELVAQFLSNEAVWRKAIQRLRDDGKEVFAVQDIPVLCREVTQDVLAENEEDVKDILWNLVKKDIARVALKGFAEWYKDNLREINGL